MSKIYQEEYTKVGLCVSCTLSVKMLNCANCPFSVGLPVRVLHHTCLKLEPHEKEELWSSLPAPLWDVYFDYLSKGPATYPDHYNPYKALLPIESNAAP